MYRLEVTMNGGQSMRRFSVAFSLVLLLGLAGLSGIAPRFGDAHPHAAADEGTETTTMKPYD